ISFAPNTGGGHFGPATITKPPYAQGKIGVGDFNGDGKLDFVAVGAGDVIDPNNYQAIQLFLGNGDGSFRNGTAQTFGGTGVRFPAAVYVGDFNNDGKLDLIVFLESNGGWTLNDDVYEFLGNGDGTFHPAQLLFSHFGPMAVADVNHDGRSDLIQLSFAMTSNQTPIPAQFSIYLGQPGGAFPLTATYAPYFNANLIPQFNYSNSHYQPMIADLNGDGNLDIAVFQKGTSVIAPSAFLEVLLGNGDGTFTPTFSSFDFQKYYFPNLGADVNADGRADLVELDGYRASFHVLPSIPGPAFQFSLVADPVVGTTGKGLLTLAVPASSSTTMSLTASDPAIHVPTTVTIPAGNVTQVFSFSIGSAFNKRHVFSLTAQLGSEIETAYGTQSATRTGGFTLSFYVGPYTLPNINLAAGQDSTAIQILAGSKNGYGTTLTFKCLGMPAQVQCQFSPPNVPVRPADTSVFDFVVSVGASATNGSYPGKIEASDGVLIYDLPITLNVGDFSMSITPPVVQMLPSDIASPTVTLSSIFSYNQVVNLSCSAPAGVLCGLPPFANPAPSGSQVTLGLQTQSTPVGSYRIGVAGTSTPLSHSASAQLQVWDFNPSVTPLSATVKAGSSANFNLNVDSVNGFNGPVSLYCATSAGGLTCAFNPSTLTVSAGTTVTAALTINVAPGLASKKTRNGTLLYATWITCGTLPLLLCWGGTRQKLRRSASILLVLFLVSCGGGAGSGSGGGNGGGTGGGGGGSSRNYTVTVQVGSGSNYVKAAGKIQLTVN
ncbi:MAG: hypothetical protein JWN45_2099, partial [Acidobacteriaceae bacterium]|nr:hypothetical protein [Acidobacteriaceae bacterium]